MTLTIDLPPAMMQKLQAEAAATGKDVETFVREAVEVRLARRRPAFAEAIQPIQAAIAASDLMPEQAEALFEHEVLAGRRERQTSLLNHDPGCDTTRDPLPAC